MMLPHIRNEHAPQTRPAQFPPYRQFDVLACADCDSKFLNTARNGLAVACPRCDGSALMRWRAPVHT